MGERDRDGTLSIVDPLAIVEVLDSVDPSLKYLAERSQFVTKRRFTSMPCSRVQPDDVRQ